MRRLVRDTLRLAGHDYVIESPAEALEIFRRLYPRAWRGGARGPADFSLAVEGERWLLRHGGETRGPLRGALEAAYALEHEVESGLVAGSGGRIALHAGGIEEAGRAHLVAGDPDSGKTTSTLLLVELGHRFLCEEVALIDPDSLAVEPHPRSLGLDRRFLDELARRRPLERGRVDRLDDHHARYAPHSPCLEPARLATIFIPRLRPGRTPGVEEVDPAQALPEILGYCFPPTAEPEEFFDRVIRMLESCRVARVRFDSVETASSLWRQLLPPPRPAS